MSRSLLLIICDFLLLSLLALARFDDPAETGQSTPLEVVPVEEKDAVEEDLLAALQASLEDAALREESLSAALSEKTQRLQTTEQTLSARERELAEREARLRQTQQTAEELAAEKTKLEEDRIRLAQEKDREAAARERLEKATLAAQEKISEAERARRELAERVATLRESSTASQERLTALQRELQEREKSVKELASERERLEHEKKLAESRAAKLEADAKAAETRAEVVEQTLATTRQDLEVEREQRAAAQRTAEQLSEGVGQLAKNTEQVVRKTEEMSEEVRRLRPISANEIFEQFRRKQAVIRLSVRTQNLFGTDSSSTSVTAPLVSDGVSAYAILHVSQTPPLTRSNLQGASGIIQLGARRFSFDRVDFLAADPRLVAVRLPLDFVQNLGFEPFALATEPLRFDRVVLLDAKRQRYADAGFKLVPSANGYVDIDRNLFNNLFGEFSPNKADFIFAKSGEFAGVMVNGSHGVLLSDLRTANSLPLGQNFRPEQARQVERSRTARRDLLPRELK